MKLNATIVLGFRLLFLKNPNAEAKKFKILQIFGSGDRTFAFITGGLGSVPGTCCIFNTLSDLFKSSPKLDNTKEIPLFSVLFSAYWKDLAVFESFENLYLFEWLQILGKVCEEPFTHQGDLDL